MYVPVRIYAQDVLLEAFELHPKDDMRTLKRMLHRDRLTLYTLRICGADDVRCVPGVLTILAVRRTSPSIVN